MWRFAFLLLIFTQVACHPDGYPERYDLVMTETIYNQKRPRVAMGSAVNGSGITEYWLDTIPNVYDNVITAEGNQLVEVLVDAVDVVLAGDSVRLGVVRYGELWPFEQPSSFSERPNALVITNWGREQLPFQQSQDGMGEITRKTVFRVGRNDYQLRSYDPGTKRLSIEPLAPGHGVEPTAVYETRYRGVVVSDLEGQRHVIRREPGRKLVLFFTPLYRLDEQRITELDKLIRARSRGPGCPQVYLISAQHRTEDIAEVLAEYVVRLPTYQIRPETCLGLNCNKWWPYAMVVDERGRIESYYEKIDGIMKLFEGADPS